jgi:hypothetical protein
VGLYIFNIDHKYDTKREVVGNDERTRLQHWGMNERGNRFIGIVQGVSDIQLWFSPVTVQKNKLQCLSQESIISLVY